MNKKYDYNDFQAVVDGKLTFEDLAKKYNRTTSIIHRQMNRAGYYISKRKIIIVSPYKKIVCNSISEAANQLNISNTSIINALKGKEITILKELHITIEEAKNESDN